MIQPHISIIVTVYNLESYIEKCLLSLINQTINNIEIIIVDDASTDNSLEIITEFEKKDNRIKVISLDENTAGGTGIPSNIGMKHSKGEYIGFVDGDDYILPDMYESLYKLAKANDSDLAICDFYTFEKEEIYYDSYDKKYWDYFEDEVPIVLDVESKRALLCLSAVPWRKLYKREYIIKTGIKFPEGDFFFEDTPFHFYSILTAETAISTKKQLYLHRVNRDEQSMKGKGAKFLVFSEHFRLISSFYSEKGLWDDFEPDYIRMVLNTSFWIWNRLNYREKKVFFKSVSKILYDCPQNEDFKKLLRTDQKIALFTFLRNWFYGYYSFRVLLTVILKVLSLRNKFKQP